MLTKSLLDLATVGGEWVLWGLLMISVISIGVIMDRAWWFFRHRCDMSIVVPELMALLGKGDTAGAASMLKAHPSEEAQIAARCLDWQHAGRDAMGNILAAAIRERRPILDRGTVFLGTVGNNAPFVGLFGTVLGVVEAFVQLGQAKGGSMESVMSAIGEALVATAVGILVAIPAVVAFNIFSRKAVQVEENAEVLVNLSLAAAEEASHKKAKAS